MAIAKIWVFCGLIAPKPYIPHTKTNIQEALPWDVNWPPKWFPSPKIVPFELYLAHKHPTVDSTHFSCFWDLESPLLRNSAIFHLCTHAESDSPLLFLFFFQKWSKSVQDKWLKGHFVLAIEKTKHVLVSLGGNPGGVPPFSCMSVHRDPSRGVPPFSCMSVHRDPSLIFQVSSR